MTAMQRAEYVIVNVCNLPWFIPNTASKTSPHQDPASQRYAVHSDTQHFSQRQVTHMLDFAKFLKCRELVTTRLTKFDNNPENFRAWESSFVNSMPDLQLSASEDLDLLVKWLGKESSDHVRKILVVYVTNLADLNCLQEFQLILQECHATLEVIESALFKCLDSF